MFSISWLKDAIERAVKTFAQALLGALTVSGADVLHMSWGQALSIGATATAISVLTSVLSAGVGSPGTASVTNAVEAAPAPVAVEPTASAGIETPPSKT